MAVDKDEIEGEEVRWERADQAIDRIHKDVETEYGPVYLSKHMRDEFIEQYRELKREYDGELAEDEVKRRLKMLTKQ